MLLHYAIEPVDFGLNVREPVWPGPRFQLLDRLPRVVPLPQMNLGLGQPEPTGRFERTNRRDLLPVRRGILPTSLLLANLGQHRMPLGLVRQRFDNRRVGPFNVLRLPNPLEPATQRFVAFNVAGREPQQSKTLIDGGLPVTLLIVTSDQLSVRFDIGGLQSDRQLQLNDRFTIVAPLQIYHANRLADNRLVEPGFRHLLVKLPDV